MEEMESYEQYHIKKIEMNKLETQEFLKNIPDYFINNMIKRDISDDIIDLSKNIIPVMIEKNVISGISPRALCASLVLVCSEILFKRYKINEILDKFCDHYVLFSDASLRNNYKKIMKIVPEYLKNNYLKEKDKSVDLKNIRNLHRILIKSKKKELRKKYKILFDLELNHYLKTLE